MNNELRALEENAGKKCQLKGCDKLGKTSGVGKEYIYGMAFHLERRSDGFD
jgi:hypothetical protein